MTMTTATASSKASSAECSAWSSPTPPPHEGRRGARRPAWRRVRWARVAALAVAAALAVQLWYWRGFQSKPQTLAGAIADARRGGRLSAARYRAPEPEQLAAFERELAEILAAGVAPAAGAEALAAKRASPTGFTALEFPAMPRDGPGARSVLLREVEMRGGPGVVVKRGTSAATAPRRSVIVECPHSFFDSDTMPIALRMFHRANALALVFNTVHRGNVREGDSEETVSRASRSGREVTDVAHNPATLFHAAHAAALTAFGGAQLTAIQVHGFRDDAVPGADVVVSAAGSSATNHVQQLAVRLRAAFPAIRVLHSPVDTRKLSAMSNVQGQLSRARGAPFLHMEIAKSWRERLMRNDAELNAFCDAVAAFLDDVASGGAHDDAAARGSSVASRVVDAVLQGPPLATSLDAYARRIRGAADDDEDAPDDGDGNTA